MVVFRVSITVECLKKKDHHKIQNTVFHDCLSIALYQYMYIRGALIKKMKCITIRKLSVVHYTYRVASAYCRVLDCPPSKS